MRTLHLALLTAALAAPTASLAADETECIGPEGYAPPEYSAIELLTILGGVPAVAADPRSLYTGFWTNWYREPLERGLVKLAVLRGILDARNLHDTHLPGALVGNIEPGDIACEGRALTARTADGSCNALDDPLTGAVMTRFGRNVPLSYAWPDTSALLDPHPRTVSQELLKRKGSGKEVPFLNLWATAWTQFQIHDWFDHGPPDRARPLVIPLAEDDPIRVKTGQTTMTVGATPADGSRTAAEDGVLPPTYANYVTQWWDASQIYGSDQETADSLRAFEGGRLKLDADGRLPKNSRGFGETGFDANWWVGLELLHTLFVREHNAIAAHLAATHPELDDQALYDKARLVNAALIAKIHTLEWTPAVLPNPALDVAMNANWYGLQRFVSPDPIQQGTLRAVVPPPEPVIYGILGGTTDDKGVAYSMTEEFAAVYRMHPLLPDRFQLLDAKTGSPGRMIQVKHTTDAAARTMVERDGFVNLGATFGQRNATALELFNYPKFMTELDLPFGGTLDLAAIDILRDRERGLPRYNDFRRALNLIPLASIDDLTPDAEARAALKRVYSDDIEKVDLFVGTLAEAQRPDCYGVGETLFQTFILMASRRLQADRFYTVDYRPEIYTAEGLAWVEANTMKSVLLRHWPELGAAGLDDVDNAFGPWRRDW